jgi:hypothetical protein
MNGRPAAFCVGRGHMIVHANAAFRAEFGDRAVGMPLREALISEPAEAFTLLDAVLDKGKPFARWIRRSGEEWRLTGAPRIDPETGEVYGVTFHLRARSDVPIVEGRPAGR